MNVSSVFCFSCIASENLQPRLIKRHLLLVPKLHLLTNAVYQKNSSALSEMRVVSFLPLFLIIRDMEFQSPTNMKMCTSKLLAMCLPFAPVPLYIYKAVERSQMF